MVKDHEAFPAAPSTAVTEHPCVLQGIGPAWPGHPPLWTAPQGLAQKHLFELTVPNTSTPSLSSVSHHSAGAGIS